MHSQVTDASNSIIFIYYIVARILTVRLKLNPQTWHWDSPSITIYRPLIKVQRSKVKFTRSQSAKRRSSGWRELCTLSSAQPLVTGRICRRQFCRYCFYSRASFGFFAPQGRHAAPIKVKFGREERTYAPPAKFHLDRRMGVGLRPQNFKKNGILPI